MKKALILLVMVAAILYAQQTASAQASFVPTFDNNKATSVHFGTGQLSYEFDFDSSSIDDVEIKQDITIFGVNWEQSMYNGFLHWRFGLMGLGDTEETSNGSTDTTTTWTDNYLFAFYMGAGYMYIGEMPLTNSGYVADPTPSMTHRGPSDITLFFGGGFDFNLYAQFAQEEDTTYDTDLGFYVFDFSIVGIVGVRMPMGFIFHFSMSANILLDWEYRASNSLITINMSDLADLKIPFIGMELGVTYVLPVQPSLRFGLLVKLIDANMFILHVGYMF